VTQNAHKEFRLTKIHAFVALMACLLAAVAVFVSLPGCPQVVPPLYEVSITNEVVYGLGNVSNGIEPLEWELKNLVLDVYEPVDAPGPKPAIVLVHGGSFSEGSKEKEEIVRYANFFAGQGFVAFAINYRLTGDYPPSPPNWEKFDLVAAAHAAMVDVKAAIRFVRANAAAYNVDPSRIALLGESAGAIAAVTAAVTNSSDFATDGPDFPVPEQNHPDVSARVYA
jgi:acetyl esterase/lipase